MKRIFTSLCCISSFLLSIACSKADAINEEPKQPARYPWNKFVMGADLSYVNAVEAAGAVFREGNQVKDPFAILHDNGTNLVRVRLWHSPGWQQSLNGGRYYSNLADVEQTIRRAKAQGMAVNLDLHYSDTWADPDHQETPAAWKGLSLPLLADSLYQYTLTTLQYLAAKNQVPEMIQVGNETTNGILWPSGQVSTAGWVPFTTLLNAGIKAVRDFSKTSAIKLKIILHVAQLQKATWWADNLESNGVTDYDVIGLSHYYKWSTVNHFDSISTIIRQLRNNTGKEVMVVETAFPFTNNNADNYNNIFWEPSASAVGYPFSVTGQLDYFTALTKAIIKGGGSGIMLWEPAWITSNLNDGWGKGSSWENNALFDFTGNLHDGIKFMTKDYGLK